MAHPIHKVMSFEITGEHQLRIRFEDGAVQTIDFSPVLEGSLYGPLRDPAIFASVRIDPEIRTLVWPNGADFDPATLYDWPRHEAGMIELARRWMRHHA